MKFPLPIIFLIVSVCLPLACKEKAEEKPTSTIIAKVRPAGAAKSMKLTPISVPETYLPLDSGTFQANNLTELAYWVTFEANAGYERAELGRIKIEPGKTINLGTITLSKKVIIDPYIGTFATTLNNSVWHSYEHGSILIDSSLTIWSNGNRPSEVRSEESILLHLKNFSGTGTYASPSYGGTTWSSNGNFYIDYPFIWSSAEAGGSFNVNITKFDTLNKRVSGNFSFHALPMPNSFTNARTATNGTFTDLKIQ